MKKILPLLVLIAGTSSIFCMAADLPDYDAAGSNMGMPTEICTVTSEPCVVGASWGQQYWSSGGQMARYRCCVQAESGFVDLIKTIYQYVFFITLVLWVLFLVILGIGYSISGVSTEEIKAQAKGKIIAGIIGIVALALIPWILKTVAPFFFQ